MNDGEPSQDIACRRDLMVANTNNNTDHKGSGNFGISESIYTSTISLVCCRHYLSGHICLYNVLNDCPANGTSALLCSPLFDAALVAGAHVAALIEDTVNWALKADGTILTLRATIISGGCRF